MIKSKFNAKNNVYFQKYISRWGYNSLENMRAAWQRTRDAGIPFDVQWGDIDYMDRYTDR